MIYAVVYTLTEYLNFGMAYAVVLNRKLRKQKYVYMLTLGFVCLLQLVILYRIDNTWMDVVNVLCGFLIPICWVEKKRAADFFLLPVVVMGTSFVNTFGSYIWAIVFGITQLEIVETPLYTLLAECTAVVVMFFGWLWKRKNSQSGQLLQVNIGQYLLLVTGFFSFAIIIAFLQGLEEGSDFFQDRARTFGMAMAGVCVVFLVLCLWQMLTLRRQEEYRRKNEAYENYMRLQEIAIKQRIEKDESMRRFRHDLYAHITAIGAIADRIGDKELSDYIAGMQRESAVYQGKKYSGIAAVDAVIGDIEEGAKQSGIRIQWDGMLNGTKEIAVYDLCTIFSNLLVNAVEACGKLMQEERVIFVKTYCYETAVYIDVRNQYRGTLEVKADGTIATDKADVCNHGFGTKNVRDTVKRNGGSIEYITENGWFEVKIVL